MTKRVICIFILASILGSSQTFALDRKLKLLFKTSGYGAATGAVIGGAFAALKVGDARNIFMGASSGMYAGILLAAYILATPTDHEAERYKNPYAPRKRVRSTDWEDEGWEDEDFPQPDSKSDQGKASPIVQDKRAHLALWVPILQLKF